MSNPYDYPALVRDARTRAHDYVRVGRAGSSDGGEDIAVITLTDPTHMNALSPPLMVGLGDALRNALVDPEVKAIVLTGEVAFSAGGDLRMMREIAHPMLRAEGEGAVGIWRWIRGQFGGVVRAIHSSEKAVIAAVTGPAAGVGMAFALASDQIVIDEEAPTFLGFARLGLLPEVGLSWTLLHRVGYAKLVELFLRKEPVLGRELVALGLANVSLPRAEVLPKALEVAGRIARLPSHLFAMTKTMLRQVGGMTFEQALTVEEFAEPLCFTTSSHQAAVNHFLDRGFGGP